MNPYIGITDFTEFRQVDDMLDVFTAHQLKGSRRKLHVGVMMSHKTLRGVKSRWQNVFPPKEAIAGIFSSNQVYNCLHYADYRSDTDSDAISEAISCCGANVHALQLDMVWPEPDLIANGVHALKREIEIILQIGENAFEKVGNNPQNLVERLKGYEGVVNRVLLDRSMGKGIAMDTDGLMPFARSIAKSFPNFGIVVAGGLGPTTVDLVKPLVKEFPDLSIDAQGRLRLSGSIVDPIEWDLAETYLVKALKLFETAN